MSKKKPAVRGLFRRRDRWGWRPARRGRLRGEIRNLRHSTEISECGTIFVYDFDIFVDDGLPLVPVRMQGTDFQNEPVQGRVVEMNDPNPKIRPVEPIRLDYPPAFMIRVVSFYPGRDDPSVSLQRLHGLLVMIGPIAAAAVMIGLFYAIYG